MKIAPIVAISLLLGVAAPFASRADPAAPGPAAARQVDPRTRDALLRALEDERAGQRLYAAILVRHGARTRPFAKILDAEEKREAELVRLCNRHGIAIPPENTDDRPQAPDSLRESCAAAARFEEANAALYEGFLAFVTDERVRAAFERLGTASAENHLPAFSWCVENDGRYPKPAGVPERCASCGMVGCGCAASPAQAAPDKPAGCGCQHRGQ